MGKVVNFSEFKLKKTYSKHYTEIGNVCLKQETQKHREEKIKKALVEGYIRLLSNYIK
jgi:hypothetical protein